MARTKRLILSQNAHHRLRMKHSDTPGKRGEILYRYHRACIGKQKNENRILSKKERRNLFTQITMRVGKQR